MSKNLIQKIWTWDFKNDSITTKEVTDEMLIQEKRHGETPGPDSFEYKAPEMFGVNLSDWTWSVEQAWSETDPSRTDLCDIYKAITSYDSQAVTAIQQRKLFTMQGSLAFYNEDGSINEEVTKLIVSPSGATKTWLKNFISYTLDSIFWGYEVVLLDIENGEIKVKKIPERNVIPCEGAILKDTTAGTGTGNKIYYNEPRYSIGTIPITYTGDLNELGLLSGVAPYFFSKVTGTWKQHADKFGMLTRVLKTDSENNDKLTGSYNALKNQVRGNFVVLGKEDELTFEGDTRTNMEIYKGLNDYCDGAIAKIILGQSSTTDEKSFAGSAGVHKQVLDAIVISDREFVESVINDQLIPKLQVLGMLPENIYFGISENVNVDLIEQSTIVKTLSDAGFKATEEYIETTFGIPLKEVTEETKNTEE